MTGSGTSSQQVVVSMKVNGKNVQVILGESNQGRTLLSVLRDDLRLTGTKEGCGTGECGACTVIMDGKPVRSCLVLAAECEGASIETIESLPASIDGGPHPLQEAFVEAGAIQCGFCSPGFIIAALCLLRRHPSPTRTQVEEAFSGHLCRCTGYEPIFKAVSIASKWIAEGKWNP